MPSAWHRPKVLSACAAGQLGYLSVERQRRELQTFHASVSAGIEAPIRFYLTENSDGTATLSHKKPGAVFAPYFEEGKDELRGLALELDGIFAKIADTATRER